MKRYQCIKNVYDGYNVYAIAFKDGVTYQECVSMDYNWSELIDDLGNVHLVTPELLANFKELPPLDEESRAIPIATKDANHISLGCAILISVILTVLALIFFR